MPRGDAGHFPERYGQFFELREPDADCLSVFLREPRPDLRQARVHGKWASETPWKAP